jgi:hypothetical protein
MSKCEQTIHSNLVQIRLDNNYRFKAHKIVHNKKHLNFQKFVAPLVPLIWERGTDRSDLL